MVRYVVLAALLGLVPAGARANAPVCIATYRINHTDVPDDTAIVITMNDRSVYRAKVQGNCAYQSTILVSALIFLLQLQVGPNLHTISCSCVGNSSQSMIFTLFSTVFQSFA